MKKSDFVNKLAKQLNKTQKETNAIVDEFSDLVTQTLKSGGVVGLAIGKFQLKQRTSRIGVNPSTGERIVVGAKVIPAFRPSKRLKDAVLA